MQKLSLWGLARIESCAILGLGAVFLLNACTTSLIGLDLYRKYGVVSHHIGEWTNEHYSNPSKYHGVHHGFGSDGHSVCSHKRLHITQHGNGEGHRRWNILG